METETQATSDQRSGTRESNIRSFGAAANEWKAPAAIDTTSLIPFLKNNVTSPITPARLHDPVSPSGAFQNLNLNSPHAKSTETNDLDSDEDNQSVIDKNSTCYSRLDPTKRAVVNFPRSQLKDFYFNVFPETIEINSEYFCFG